MNELSRQSIMMLAFCEGVSVGTRGKIVDALGADIATLTTNPSVACSTLAGVVSDKALSSINAVFSRSAEEYERMLSAKNIGYVTVLDEDYPERLMEISNPPVVLFYIGDKSLLDGDSIAVIGSRHCSKSALRHAVSFARDLALGGFQIVSGLARGIDGEAQRACVEVGGGTVAVLGSGIDVVYPAESKELYDQICSSGLVVSEYAPGTPPNFYQFPERNRIISGLSMGVLVIEARENSGALITANLAIEHGRDVFVLPTSIDCVSGRGGNAFLKEYPTALVMEPEDIFRAFGRSAPVTEKNKMALDEMESRIVTFLESGPRHFDELLEITKLNSNNLNSLLAKLEISGIIIRLAGNEFSL